MRSSAKRWGCSQCGSVRDINAPSRKVRPLQAAPGLVDGWLRPPPPPGYRLVSHAVVTGEGELTDSQAESLASKIESWTPAQAKLAYREAYEATVEAANNLVRQAGVNDLDAFYSFMEQNHSGALHDLRYAFAADNAAPLIKAAKEYLASHPDAGVNPDTLKHLMDTEPQGDGKKHVVTGGRLFYSEKGTPMVEINGTFMTLAALQRAGGVKVSPNDD